MAFVFGILIISCKEVPKKNSADSSKTDEQINDSVAEDKKESDEVTLYENRIDDIPLPFPKREMADELKRLFQPLTIVKEIGQQDGPDFPLYSLKNGKREMGYFSMDFEDTLQLTEVRINDPMVQDQYGLKVGDGYSKIKKLRSGELKTTTDYHMHTYVYFEGSKIFYEISGEPPPSQPIDPDTLKLTEGQLKNWTIESIIWRE